ncbi:MAG TPA: FAD-dependent monooxygenase [Gemmatimonadaceae bacterium]|nr:FAD-dependent monooxygenase [Gemmatimonadaceae bacterium]
MNRIPVLIVGAGPTGLVLALWLTKSGIAVRIIDKTAEAGTTSRAIGVQARTLELYRQMGIADEVLKGGIEVAGGNFWVGGKRAARISLTDSGKGLSPFTGLVNFQQDAHERMLVAQLLALGVTVERRTELLRFYDDGAIVHAFVKRPDGSEEECEAFFLAGCDGSHSVVRTGLRIGFPGGTYEELFYVADADVTGPVANHEVHIDFSTADFLAVFPMHDEGRVRLIGAVVVKSNVEQKRLTFADASDQAIRDLKVEVQKINWFSTYRVHHRVADSFRRGRAFILGDAAHVHSPVGAQGMNTGIGDAINLAWKLAAVIKGEATPQVLDSYQPERIRFARRLVSTTDRVFSFVTKRGTFASLVRRTLLPVVLPLIASRPSARRLAFRTISQLGIEYRESPLSAGSAGDIHGGDRLPWVPLSDTEDNFAPLTSMNWQAHVYGEARVSARVTCAEQQIPLHIFPWSPEAKKAGLMRSALYLVRPDGYVALANRDGGADGLRSYFAQRGLSPSALEPFQTYGGGESR